MDSAKAVAMNENLLGATYIYNYQRGSKLFELSNHLGNVLTTISDRKFGHKSGSLNDYYTADVVSATDYYPFGMEMPNRTYSSPTYRYGFNGKEKDNEAKGEGNQQDYGMRVSDPRLGRFLSVDPITKKYPELTPYQFASNTPIQGIDQDGLEVYYTASGALICKNGTSTQVRVVNDQFVKDNYGKSVLIKDMNANSRDVGMTNEELNTRAFLSTLKQTENNAEKPLPYNTWNGFKKNGTPQTFTDKKYEDAPEEYADHPGPNPNHGKNSAAGAYQIMKGSWNQSDSKFYRSKYGIKDFSSTSQDRFTLVLIKDKRNALEEVKAGSLDEAIKKLAKEWRSLPGPKTQFKSLTVDKVKAMFKQNVSNELNGNSNIALPVGTTLKF